MPKPFEPNKKPRFRVGEKVKYRSMNEWCFATITEVRGPLGVKGQRLYDLEYPDVEEPGHIVLPEDELEPAA